MGIVMVIISSPGAGIGTERVIQSGTMPALTDWKALEQSPLPVQTLACIGVFLAFVIPSLAILIPIRFRTKVPSFVFRKMLHAMAFLFSALMILVSPGWRSAALAALIAAVLLYPLLGALEKHRWYGVLFVQKRPGEVRRSMVMIFAALMAVVGVLWGIFGQRQLAAASILMWGFGDAAAALVGIPFGQHKVKSGLTDGKKSWEGSAAMLAVSFLCGFAVLLWGQQLAPLHAVRSAGAAAVLCTLAELFSPGEWDTFTVPAVTAGALLLLCAP